MKCAPLGSLVLIGQDQEKSSLEVSTHMDKLVLEVSPNVQEMCEGYESRPYIATVADVETLITSLQTWVAEVKSGVVAN